MFTQLKNVFVDKLSLVTKSENPAVPKATTKYALFKTKKNNNLEKIEVVISKLQRDDIINKCVEKLQS